MVAAATKHTGQQALHLTFDEINFTEEFDGIWAYGSLVHNTVHLISLTRLLKSIRLVRPL